MITIQYTLIRKTYMTNVKYNFEVNFSICRITALNNDRKKKFYRKDKHGEKYNPETNPGKFSIQWIK